MISRLTELILLFNRFMKSTLVYFQLRYELLRSYRNNPGDFDQIELNKLKL